MTANVPAEPPKDRALGAALKEETEAAAAEDEVDEALEVLPALAPVDDAGFVTVTPNPDVEEETLLMKAMLEDVQNYITIRGAYVVETATPVTAEEPDAEEAADEAEVEEADEAVVWAPMEKLPLVAKTWPMFLKVQS